ncbi:MAG: hypothetical protein COZ49_01955 [Candidatus Yonathbacteria bacterium CG_4_10_14_3_um_filter_47_65]|uniref:Rhodanese domain-containing protein n=2 Tax=Parcubacteria group TaxID=1794811 RepID=A0A2M8D8K4_9BACT|nr:MAG: hypothetical protein AUJ44_00850 [Candidatus Nomurabacteria bacterium CG1_02_47_685]PIP03530.1 MAG: hypothetical protein COX54_03300 [Candidatus Yonathbacteria bacterium CG23_combo_of_CG06-09_8_20_14_all_46_18]PIQ32622.1 MAG: hypothetical protein COW61_01255 [Candidatus Yonathbacteria bacterium CG17_big_fil_post_rev_8_21_14_2_50_46_19]PIX56469.1 MAG: hypothetical protein COZ49_01955 [Candidatus Yonathbacteria bacterium CG_4_10_14_3_um_filter_47_65]PIY57561.1 MAG: hypothetical protein CO
MQTKYIIAAGLAVISISVVFILLSNRQKYVPNAEEHEDESIAAYEIYPSDVVKKIKNNENIVLLDVRTPKEYEEEHLQNAILLPVQELSAQSLANVGLGEDAKDKEIIVYCRSGTRSKTAHDIMSSLGYTNIKSIAGGMTHWEEDDYPFTETGDYRANTVTTTNSVIPADGPRISFDRTFHDFGLVPQYGGIVTETFTIQNDGTDILNIGDIMTSCSCTSASVSSKSIAAGESAKLTVRFDPNFHKEPLDVFKRTIFIPTNVTTTPEAEVVIQVDIDEGK